MMLSDCVVIFQQVNLTCRPQKRRVIEDQGSMDCKFDQGFSRLTASSNHDDESEDTCLDDFTASAAEKYNKTKGKLPPNHRKPHERGNLPLDTPISALSNRSTTTNNNTCIAPQV